MFGLGGAIFCFGFQTSKPNCSSVDHYNRLRIHNLTHFLKCINGKKNMIFLNKFENKLCMKLNCENRCWISFPSSHLHQSKKTKKILKKISPTGNGTRAFLIIHFVKSLCQFFITFLLLLLAFYYLLLSLLRKEKEEDREV